MVPPSAERRDLASDLDEHANSLRDDPLYLGRCQVDTPSSLVQLVWQQVSVRRPEVDLVVDFGAGDGRFAEGGRFGRYLGYEVDARRFTTRTPRECVQIVGQCAFSHDHRNADVCVGNPPYVRNQDLPTGWRQMAAAEIQARTGVVLSGLANAWQYFLMLGLWSVHDKGLVAQVLPFEWVSRPASGAIRRYIDSNGWSVDVYRLRDGIFEGVLTAASVTIIDKLGPSGWRFHDFDDDDQLGTLSSPTGTDSDVLGYTPVREPKAPRAKRGLSPGTQQVLTLTEGERVHAGLHIRSDVVRCVTSLRHTPADLGVLDQSAFEKHFVSSGAKCWLIRTDREPSARLQGYLAGVDSGDYQTATCLEREDWWRFAMPVDKPQLLVAQAFKGAAPKVVVNDVGALPVGGVAGIYNVHPDVQDAMVAVLTEADLASQLVPYAKQMRKLEINQINSLLSAVPLLRDA